MKQVPLDRNQLCNRVHNRLLADTIAHYTGCESQSVKQLLTSFGISFESHTRTIQSMDFSMTKQVLLGFLAGIESVVDHYWFQKQGVFPVRDEYASISFAMEAAEEDIVEDMKEDADDSDIGGVVVEIIKSITDRNTEMTNETIRDVSKMILEMEKEKQEEIKDALLAEEQGKEEALDDEESGAQKEDSHEDTDTNDTGNPFEDASETGEETKKSGNPFDDPTTDSESNTSDSDDQSTKKDDSDHDKDSSDGEKKDSEDGVEKNPFAEESLFLNPTKWSQVVMESVGGPGKISHMAVTIAKELFVKDMEQAFDQYGIESETYQSLETGYKRVAKQLTMGTIGILSMESILHYSVDKGVLQYPELYFQNENE